MSSRREAGASSRGERASKRSRRNTSDDADQSQAGERGRVTRSALNRTIPSAPTIPQDEPSATTTADNSGPAEEVNEDDLCPVCQLLLCNPVITGCGHTLCKTCMATWADVSLSAPMTIVSVDEQPREFDVATGLEARCPMCRTQTSATLDENRTRALRLAYPRAYAERQAEEQADEEQHHSIQTITVYIGNRHELVEPEEDSPNMHQWTFFVKPSRVDIIEEVQIFLHPTFRPPRIIRTRPPYEIRRLGWGYFTIEASVILKPGYSWVSSDAEDSSDGAPKGLLKLEWTLDFSSFGGTGAMGRCRLKVKNDKDWEDSDEERRDEAETNRVIRQYQRDGRYEPPVES